MMESCAVECGDPPAVGGAGVSQRAPGGGRHEDLDRADGIPGHRCSVKTGGYQYQHCPCSVFVIVFKG